MAIIVDYSASAIASILAFQNELKQNIDQPNKIEDLIRHVILSTFQSYRRKYRVEYGELIIACDGKGYWRREYFQYYKGSRKKNRDQSSLPWGMIFDTMNKIRLELIENFPYKVIQVDRTEADDVIAVLTKWFQDNELVQQGLFESPQKIMIISSDGDFKQLQKYGNVDQWSPMTKKLVKAPSNYMKEGHIEHIVKGDSGDGVPSIVNEDDVLITEGVRQKPVSKKRLEEFYEKGIDACKNDFERRNWMRNQTLVDLDYIPEDISQSIIDTYQSYTTPKNRQGILNYLIQNRCRNLISSIEDF